MDGQLSLLEKQSQEEQPTWLEAIQNAPDGESVIRIIHEAKYGCLQTYTQGPQRCDVYVWEKLCRLDKDAQHPYAYCNKCAGIFLEQPIRTPAEARKIIQELEEQNKPVPMGLKL